MAEQFITLMADLDDESQKMMGNWYDSLKAAGFTGIQTPDIPYHITLASFSLEKEAEVKEEMKQLAGKFSPIPVHISHIGLFAGGKVLFGAPDMNPSGLLTLREAIQTETIDIYPWTPHATILLDDLETIQKALPVLLKCFRPFSARITKLHLCAFWPTREIASFDLGNSKNSDR